MKLVILEFSNTQPIAKIVDPEIGLSIPQDMNSVMERQEAEITKVNEIFHHAVECRMKACFNKLENAKRINPIGSIILYENGSFNTETYETMVTSLNISTEKWDIRQWQQCLKALNNFHDELIAEYGKKDYDYAFGVATEYMCMAR